MIINLTQHPATAEQVAAGVQDLPNSEMLRMLLTFDRLPIRIEIEGRAKALAMMAEAAGADAAMIGGAPFLMSKLEAELLNRGIRPMYAFSKRIVKETKNFDGTVTKTSTFAHEGFIMVRYSGPDIEVGELA